MLFKRGERVRICVPTALKHKLRNLLNYINRSFFESLWVEIQAQFKSKTSNKLYLLFQQKLEQFFVDKLTSETSGAYSTTGMDKWNSRNTG